MKLIQKRANMIPIIVLIRNYLLYTYLSVGTSISPPSLSFS